MWRYLELVSGAKYINELSADLKFILVVLPVLKKEQWSVRMRSFQLSLRQQQEHWLCQLAPHVPPSEHQDLRLFHVELDFQYWGCLQLHPENRITVNQSIYA